MVERPGYPRAGPQGVRGQSYFGSAPEGHGPSLQRHRLCINIVADGEASGLRDKTADTPFPKEQEHILPQAHEGDNGLRPTTSEKRGTVRREDGTRIP